MNDADPAAAASRQTSPSPRPNHERGPTTDTNRNTNTDGQTSATTATATASSSASAAAAAGSSGSEMVGEEEGNRMKRRRRETFLDNLIRSLDILFYCELSILFYMDCSLFRFLVRALPHWFYFTPKPEVFPPPPDMHRPYVGMISGTNLFCLFLHMVSKPPIAGEAVHGYLHGGFLIDFVGQASPVSKVRLLGLDFITLILQLLMMAVTIEKQMLQGRRTPASRGSLPAADDDDAVQAQNYDLEERGMLGSDGVIPRDSIELIDLPRSHQGRTGGEEDGERDELLDNDLIGENRNGHPLDPFYTGEYNLARLPIMDIVRVQWRLSSLATRTAGASSATSGSNNVGDAISRRITFGFGGRALGS